MVDVFELTPFVQACGLQSPIDLRIVRNDGAVLAEGQLDLPCAIAGRDPICEVTLLDAEISLRHACLQAIGGRVLVADIGSRTGLHSSDELTGPDRQPFLWLTPTNPVAVGPFRITLRKPLFVRPTITESSPFLPDPTISKLPRVAIRFLNGKSIQGEWVVNRLMTFVGRSKDCKISLGADDVAPFHCYFVLTPDGLWVVDLLNRSPIRINGEEVRYAHLKTGDQLQVGRFRLGFEYLPALEPEVVMLTKAPEPRINRMPIPKLMPKAAHTPPLGITKSPVPRGPVTPSPKQTPPPRVLTPSPRMTTPPPRVAPMPDFNAVVAPLVAMAKPVEGLPTSDPALAPLIHSFSAAQTQMMEQFQSSMMMMLRMFGEMHREQMSNMQDELARMAELNSEMQRLQLQLAHGSQESLALTPASNLPTPEEMPEADETSAAQHNWVYERMAALQVERQTLWQRLFGMMTPKAAT
ncbi:MAG: FHA domain-containing protein [Fimbriiglobus sp.]